VDQTHDLFMHAQNCAGSESAQVKWKCSGTGKQLRYHGNRPGSASGS